MQLAVEKVAEGTGFVAGERNGAVALQRADEIQDLVRAATEATIT
jgi:hypothetical protein